MSIGLRQIPNFHFNIKHSKLFDKVFQNFDRSVEGLGWCWKGLELHPFGQCPLVKDNRSRPKKDGEHQEQ